MSGRASPKIYEEPEASNMATIELVWWQRRRFWELSGTIHAGEQMAAVEQNWLHRCLPYAVSSAWVSLCTEETAWQGMRGRCGCCSGLASASAAWALSPLVGGRVESWVAVLESFRTLVEEPSCLQLYKGENGQRLESSYPLVSPRSLLLLSLGPSHRSRRLVAWTLK